MTLGNSSAIVPASTSGDAKADGVTSDQPAKPNSQATQQVDIVFEQVVSAGPLPAVRDFAGYEQVCPGAARDIIDMAIKQQRHTHWVAKAEFWAGFALKISGLVAAISLVIAMLFTAFQLAIHEKSGVALAVLAGTGLTSVASLFLRQRILGAGAQAPVQQSQQKRSSKRRK